MNAIQMAERIYITDGSGVHGDSLARWWTKPDIDGGDGSNNAGVVFLGTEIPG
jgi:hypothetical protein